MTGEGDGAARPPGLPDLAGLSPAQKDELIRSLWETVVALDGTRPPTAAACPGDLSGGDFSAKDLSTEDLAARIRGAPPSRHTHAPGAAAPRLGAGLGFLGWRPLQWLVLLVGLGFLADSGIGWAQRRALARQEAEALALRSAAFQGLYVELARVSHEPDGKTYRAVLNMQNLDPGNPLYVMLNPARVFVQAGLAWREVPSRAPEGAGWGVVRLEGAGTFTVLFEAPLDDWSELIPGYMHVLIESEMLISRSPTPRDDIVERDNRFYVYLKPQGADDAAIKARNNFPGAPPVFIPMPPH